MTVAVFALQSVLGTTDCQFVTVADRREKWSSDDDATRALWQRFAECAAMLDIDWATGAETCSAPALDLGAIVINRQSPPNAAVRRFGLLDGYRRLMSAIVMLAALSREAESRGDAPGAARIRDKYLVNRFARYPRDRWRLIPAAVDLNGWDELMSGAETELSRTAGQYVTDWYAAAPERDVETATYRLERAIVGWASVVEHTVD